MGYSEFDGHTKPAWNVGRKVGPKRALKQKETPETLREFDLKTEIMFERLDKELAEMRSQPGFDPRKIELHQMKIAAKRKELPEHRKFILDAIAGHHGKTPPNPISIAVWAGAGAFVAFVVGVFIASAGA